MADEGFKRNKAGRKNRNKKYIARGRTLHLRANPGWDDEVRDANRARWARPSTPIRSSSSSRSYG